MRDTMSAPTAQHPAARPFEGTKMIQPTETAIRDKWALVLDGAKSPEEILPC
jgi:hypothetical protein